MGGSRDHPAKAESPACAAGGLRILDGSDDNTYEWVAAGITPQKQNLQHVPPEVCASWYRQFEKQSHVIIRNLEAIREQEPSLYQVLKPQGIRSLVVVPLEIDGAVRAFYGVDNPPADTLEDTIGILHIMGHFITASLKRRGLMRKLQDLSYRDQQTRLGNRYALQRFVEEYHAEESLGVMFCDITRRGLMRKLQDLSYRDQQTRLGNRYALQRFVEEYHAEESLGVMFCDITGLKRVNDEQGHKAGDEMIAKAAESLREVCGRYQCFRFGGDELLALCMGISEDTAREKERLLKAAAREKGTVLSVGTAWAAAGEVDIDGLMTEAEGRMYQDKSNYYRTMGIDRRKN